MAANDEIECSNSYEDFEPLCKWQRQDDFDILEVHLPEFEIEELKVRMVQNNILIITGERSMSNGVKSRFRKEIKMSNHIKKEGIHAKLVKSGILYVTLPKKTKTLASNHLLESCNSMTIFKGHKKLVIQFVAILLAIVFGSFLYKTLFCRD